MVVAGSGLQGVMLNLGQEAEFRSQEAEFRSQESGARMKEILGKEDISR